MPGKRDCDKRLKGMGIPIEVCVKYERRAGVKIGHAPTKAQRDEIAKMMVTQITLGVADVVLTAKDYELILEEVKANERSR